MSELKRNKDGDIKWPRPSRHLRGVSLIACKKHYQEAGMFRQTSHEKEFWGRVRLPLATLDDPKERHIRSYFYEDNDPDSNNLVKREGWCVECKEPLEHCCCDLKRDMDLVELMGE